MHKKPLLGLIPSRDLPFFLEIFLLQSNDLLHGSSGRCTDGTSGVHTSFHGNGIVYILFEYRASRNGTPFFTT